MFAGTWVNERGSAMILEQQGDRISGRYVTRIGHEDVAEKDHSIVGVATGTTIGFVVAWPAAGSVTSWAGRVETDAGGNAPCIRCGTSFGPSAEIRRMRWVSGKVF